MKIAIIGSRGIPAKYGGFETFADGLSTRLVKKGFDITVSCEYEDPIERLDDYHGVKLEYFPLKPPKNYFLRMVYENLSDIYFLLKLTRHHDIVYFLGIEVGMFLFIPKLLKRKIKLMVNIDGVMWKRSKFNRISKLLLQINHYFATIFADTIIVDAQEMRKYVPNRYQKKTVYISYGIEEPEEIAWDSEKLKKLDNFNKIKNLQSEEFWLVVARLEPENNIHMIVKAFSESDTKYPLIVIGDYTSDKYKNEVEKLANNSENIIFLGSIYDLEVLDMFRQNCFAYIHGHTVGGTNPSLLEAMIMKNLILAHDNGFNREVCGDSGLYFKNTKNIKNMVDLISAEMSVYFKYKNTSKNLVKKNYIWNEILNKYIEVFEELVILND
jgi:rhamnosyltransferase